MKLIASILITLNLLLSSGCSYTQPDYSIHGYSTQATDTESAPPERGGGR